MLVKGTYETSREEPINEWLAAQICLRLGFDYCDYSIDVVNDKIVSKCKNFVSKDEEILKTIGSSITRIDITKLNGLVDEYRNILEKYKLYTDCSSERIYKLCEGLQMRIELLQKNIEKYK